MTNPADGSPARTRRPSPVSAILAGLLGLVLAGALGYLPGRRFIEFGFSELPGEIITVLALYLLAAVLLLIGALAVFFRAVAGAVLLIAGAVLGAAAVLLEPALIHGGDYRNFFELVFRLEAGVDGYLLLVGTVLSPVVFFLAILPPTFRYLRQRGDTAPPDYRTPGRPTQSWEP
ncbi:hypothetical protein [Amycolatopsis nigrescens]|uniref:hypothetical protein n=1 Tax=Amycolatopsis nigrescens TaxID=381445 RepID=UPI00036A862B|nr:hypothetical protein [Amycolatopsis nigrescens]